MAAAVSTLTSMESIQSSAHMDMDARMDTDMDTTMEESSAPPKESSVPEKRYTPADFRRVRTLGTGMSADEPRSSLGKRPIDPGLFASPPQEPLREYASSDRRTLPRRTETRYMR